MDNPHKFGHDPAGAVDQAYLDAMKAKYQGCVQPPGYVPLADVDAEAARLATELEETKRRLAEREAQYESMRTVLTPEQEQRLAEEQAQDEAADAVRGARSAQAAERAQEAAGAADQDTGAGDQGTDPDPTAN